MNPAPHKSVEVRRSEIIDEVVDLGMRSKVRVEHELHFEDQWNDAFLLNWLPALVIGCGE